MLIRRLVLGGAMVLLSAIGTRCFADTLTFTATLKGSSETPPNTSPGTGSALVTLNGNILTVIESFSGLTAPASAAHIHCCQPPGTAAPVVIPFAGFPNATSGTFSGTFDLSTFVFSGGATEASFLAGLESGLAYVNIHDVNFPGGEIRGQLTQVTPEPASLWLLGSGVLAACGMMRRRMRA